MDSLRHMEASWIVALQSHGDSFWVIWLMKGLSYLGLQIFYVAAVALYLGYDRRVGIRFCGMFFGAAAVSEILKLASHGPRPFWINPQVQNFTSLLNSFGMPSGHMFYAACGWAFLASLINRPWSKAVAATAVALVGLSRVWLGAHFISDVVAGLAAGLIYWRLFTAICERYGDALNQMELRVQLGLSVGLAGFVHALGLALRPGGLNAARQAGWLPFVDVSRWYLAGAAGALLGLGVGLAFAQRHARFIMPKSLLLRVGCILVGGGGLAFYHYGFKVPAGEYSIGTEQLLIFVRYTSLAVWLMFFAPAVCLRLGWLEPVANEAG